MSATQAMLVVALVFQMHGLSPDYGVCIVTEESHWNASAVGDDGAAVGYWQWHKGSINWALADMGIAWDWEAQGDPRLDVHVATVAAAHMMCEGYAHWWSRADRICRERGL